MALAAQLNHGSVGPINSALYQILGPRGPQAGIADVVSGDDSVVAKGVVTVPGFTAGKGFDVASGWGSIDASKFVPALVAATRSQNDHNSPREQAADALSRLQHGVRLTQSTVAPGGTTYMFANGFLPQHPIKLTIDGKPIATLTANTLGAVTYLVDPAMLTLSPGRHTLALQSLLLNQTTTFRSN
jgi:hypothetical protein